MGLFGNNRSPNAKEQLKEWTTRLRKEGRNLERQILCIQREEAKVKRSLKDAAKKGHKDVCLTLAKELVSSKKVTSRIYSATAQLKSVEHSLAQQAATVRMSGVIEKSTVVMQSMSRLINVAEISATMRDLSKEMMKAGVLEEMIEDTFEGMEDADLEEDAEKEVDKILWEITAGELGKAPAAGQGELAGATVAAAAAVEEDEDEEDVSEIQARLEALRS